MKIIMEMDNLQTVVETALNENIENVVREEIDKLIAQSIQESKETIQNIINDKMARFVEDYLTTATISVGGGWREEPKTYTIEEYIKSEIADRMESGKFLFKDRYSKDTYKSFDEFCKERFNVDTAVQKELTAFMEKVKSDINSNVSEMFNQATQTALSSSIINLLMQNDTFINMQDSVKRIANRE